MACSDDHYPQPPESYWQNFPAKSAKSAKPVVVPDENLSNLTAILCDHCRTLIASGKGALMTRELSIWYTAHMKEDAARDERERSNRQAEIERKKRQIRQLKEDIQKLGGD